MTQEEMLELDAALMEKNRTSSVSRSPPPGKYQSLVQPCVAELVGTMFFVFVGCMSVIENNPPSAGPLQPALVHGLAVAVLVSTMEKISGSHFSPVFSVAVWLCGGLRLKMVGPYMLSQVIGGVLGAGMAKLMTPADRYAQASGAAFSLLRSEDQLLAAIMSEVTLTCLVTTVVLLTAVNATTKTPLAPFVVGCSVTVCVLAGAGVSGPCLNPVRALGPAVMTNHWTFHWVYWVGPAGGALLAAALVRLVLGDEKLRIALKS